MNKIFKVVWSKTKECYVVVSEVAKNNGGKKKVLASVLAGLAVVGVGVQMGTPVQAESRYNKSTIVVAPDGLSPFYSTGTYKGSANNDVSYNSVVVGFLNDAYSPTTNGHFVFGANNRANNESTLALGNNNEATGPSSTAIGSGSEATGRDTIAMGNVAKANQIGNLAIGSYAKAETSGTFKSTVTNATETKGYAVALGGYAEATEHSTVAVGAVSKASGFKATAVGAGAQAKGDNSTVVGTASVANSGDSFVGGFKNVTHGDRNVAVGTNNTVAGEDSIGVGSGVIATTGKTIAIGNTMVNPTYPNGRQTIARGKNKLDGSGNPMYGTTDVDNIFALAIGNGAQADGTAKSASGMIAIGQEVTADNNNTVAIGVQTKATGSNALAIGSTAQAIGASSAAFGTQAVANGLGATAFGPGASAGDGSTVADGSTAVGRKSTVTVEGGTGIGWATTVSAKDATAIGHSATANIVGGVALGSNSVTTTAAGVQGYNPATGRTNKYSDQNAAVGTSTLAAVSVGNGTTATRQITGLAAGTDDTDAVNVAQLKNVNLKYAADTGNSDVLLKDGTLKVKGDNDLISTSVVATGADKGAVQITAKVGGTINNTDGKAVKPTTNGIATTDNVADAINNSYWKATAGGNTDGTPSVGNVKPGTQVTYSAGDNLKVKQTIAANGNQEYKYSLNPVLTGITSIANTTTGPKMTFGGNSINITGGSLDMGNNKITNLATGTDDKDAVNVKQLKDTEIHITPGTYTPDSNKKVTLTYENGDNKTVAGKTAVIDLSGLATGGTASTESVVKKAAATGDTNIADVSVAGGKAVNDPGAQYEVSVSKNAVKDAAREAVTVNNGGNTDNPISVTPTQDNTNHNTTYAVTFDGNKAAKQIPLTYKATNGTITTADQTVKLDKGLNFTGGDYTTASVGADGKVTFDVTLGTAPTVTDGKPGVPGQAGAAGKDGIATVKTVVDTINNSGWKANAKANGGNLDGSATATVVKPGNTVNYAAGKNITVKQELETDGAGALTGNQTYTYSLNKDIDLTSAGSLTVGDTTVNNGGITIKAPTPAAGTTATTTDVKLTNTGLDNGGNKIVNVAEGTADTDAVNVKQLKDAKTVLADGKNTKKSGTGTAADPYKVNVEGDLTGISSITNDGTNNGKISFGPNKTVTVDGDHSITLNASTGKIGGLQNKTFDPTNFTSGQAATEDQLKSVHDTLKASELHIAPTASTLTNEHLSGTASGNTAAGAAPQAYKYDATTKQVVLEYNDGTGANKTGTKAVIDFSALNTGGTTASTWTAKTSAENTTAGSEVGKHAGDTSQVIGDQNSVDFQAGKNMTVKQTNDGNGNTTINYALDKNLDVESVHVGKDGKDGKIGIDGKDGVDGLDGTNRVDIHVEKGAKGVDGTDGHDGVNGHNGKDGMTRIVYEDKGGKQEVATLNDGMKYAGDDAQGTDKTKVIAKKLNETLDIIGGANKTDLTTDNIGVNNDGNGKLLVQLSKKLKGLDSVQTKTVELGDHTTPGGTTNITYNAGDKRIEYTTPGATAGTTDTKKVATTDDIWTIQGNGTDVKPVNGKVNVKAGENVVITTPTTADGSMTINAVSPVVYTTPAGDKLTKKSDGKFYKADGSEYTDGDIIASFENPNANSIPAGKLNTTDGGMIVNNVGSAINNHATPGVTSPTYLDKLDAAAGDTKTQNAAVNVTDLKNTADGLTNKGLKFNANEGGVKTNKLGSTVTVQGSGTLTAGKAYADEYNTANIRTKIDQDSDGNTTINVGLAKALKDINSISNGASSITLNSTPGGATNTPAVQITGGNLSMGDGTTNNKIVNLAPGTDGTDAVNLNQLKGMRTVVTSTDKSVTVTSNENTATGQVTYDLKVATTGTVSKSTWDLKSGVASATEGTHSGDTTQTIADTKSVTMQAGKNLTVKQTNDGAGNASVAYSLDKDISVETVNVTGQNGKDGKIGIDGKDGVDGKDGKNRVEITVEKGAKGVDGTDGHDGVNGHNGKDGMTRIVYEDKGGKQEVATLNDGMKYAGDDAQGTDKTKVIAKKLNETLDIIGGANKTDLTTDNIGVNNDGNGKLLVQLSKKLKGLDSVQTKTVELGDHTTPGGTTNITYNAGDKRIEYTTPGATAGTTDTKKVATTDDIWTIQGNGTDVKPVNGKVNVKAGENVVITTPTTADGSMTINAVSPVVYTTPAGDKLTKKSDGKFYKADGSEYTDGDIIASFENPNANSIPAGKLNTTDGGMIVNNVGSAIKGLGSTGDNYLTKLDLANTATPNAAVNVSDLKSTADALKSNELHIRPTTSGRTGETVNQGATGTAESYKYDATTKSVTLKYNDGTGAGVTGTEAKIDLSGLADQITSGYTFSTNAKGNLADGTTATATAVGNGKTVSFAAGKNLTVEQNIDATTGEHTYTYALSDKITAGKDGVNGKDGSVGVTGKDGSSVVINGADGSIGMTGPKGQDGKDGINGRDGANLSMTSAKGEQVLVNRDPAHNADTDKAERIVYVPKDASGNPIQDANGKNIVREVATMDDGLKFTGNNESTENKHKLGSLVKVQGEGVTENTTTNKLEANGEEFKSASGNIAVVADSIDKLTVKLNKNLAGINKISNGGSSITLNDNPSTTTPAVTISGGNLSMGDGTHNNKIVNVAPGTDDSDAVNYKQLKDAKTVLADGKNTKKSGTGTAADPYKVNVEGDLTEITSITNKADASGDAGKITFSPNQTVTVSGDHNISLNGKTGDITGLTNTTIPTTAGSDFATKGRAATEEQLKSVHDTLKANERHIAPTSVATGSTENKGGTANAGGTANVYKYDAASKTVTLTYNDGNGNAVTDTKAVIDLSNLSTGSTGASSWNVKSSANTTDGGAVDVNHNANAQNIADGKSVEFQSGKNLVVKQTNDTTNGNATVEFSLSDNITVGKDGANGKDGSVGAKGADGSAVVMNGKDGSIGLNGTNGANGISIKGKDGANGVGIDGKDGVTRIVYTEKVPDPANPGTTKEVTHEVATMDDGLKFTGNNTSTENKQKLGSLVKVQGEGTKESTVVDPATGKKYVVLSDGTTKFESAKDNIAVEADGTDTLTVKLNKNLKGLNSIQLGGNTIQSNGDNITFTTNGGTTKTVATTDQLWTIQANGTDVPAKSGKVNLVAGDHITITPDAANGKMTISATGFGSMDGFKVTSSAESTTVGTHAGDASQEIKNGNSVDFQAGKNITVKQTNDGNGNTTVNYALNKDVDLGTNGSLKTGDTTINNDGFKNGNTTVGGNGMTIKDPTDPTKTVSLTKDGLNNGGNQITNVASGGNVDTNAANIGDIKRLAKDTRIKDGTYTVDNTGTVELTYVDGAGNQVKDASGNAITAKITGLTTLDSTRVNVAVNETGSGKAVGSTTPVKVTKGTEFVAGDNLIVERKAHTGNDLDNSVVYSLNKDLKGIETIKNGNTTITLHNNPTTATDPTAVTITGGNINMGGNRIVNIAPAKDGTDAVNLDQLKAARTKVTSNDGTVSVNRSENKATGEITYDLHVTPGQSPDLTRITNKVDQLGEEIGRVGAQGAALSALKPIQYDPLEPTQIMAGYGNYRGNSAVALGVAHYKNESTLIHGGVSWAGGSSHMMANAGVTWKVGNRDSEAAVADRYRKGPISSAYAMQQEMAAMKAQNAGLKGEVSDLKAENEQMKAQIAAMMAKLGL